jgi:hypothetical protein
MASGMNAQLRCLLNRLCAQDHRTGRRFVAMSLWCILGASSLAGCATSASRPLSIIPHARANNEAKVVSIRTPVEPPGGGGGYVPPYPDPCPDCGWNPEISNAMPSDQGSTGDPNSACLEIGLGYDAFDQACWNDLPRIKWHFSRTVYGQCIDGNYLYVNGGYDLGCQAPSDSPTGVWYLTATLTTLKAFSIIPLAPVVYENGEWFDVQARGLQSAFTNM